MYALIYSLQGITVKEFIVLALITAMSIMILQTLRSILFPPKPIILKYQPQMLGDITLDELAKYNGLDPFRPILFAVRSHVYDVTEGRDFYGHGGGYHIFAGREISRALGIMSISEKECNDNLADFTPRQHEILADWERKFNEKYTIVGRIVAPLQLTVDQLAQCNGCKEGQPILLSVKGRIYDVTPGRDFYGPDGAYPFGGRECARALAKFSTEEADLTGDLEGCTFSELDGLRDWIGRFESKYKVVGRIITNKEK